MIMYSIYGPLMPQHLGMITDAVLESRLRNPHHFVIGKNLPGAVIDHGKPTSQPSKFNVNL